MFDKLVSYITSIITGIDANNMNLDEFFVWWNTSIKVKNMIYIMTDIIFVVVCVIAVALISYLIVRSVKSKRSEKKEA